MSKILIGSTGSGKTYKALEIVNNNDNCIMVVALNSDKHCLKHHVKNSKEKLITFKEFLEFPIRSFFMNKEIVIDDINQCLQTYSNISEFMSALPDGKIEVIDLDKK